MKQVSGASKIVQVIADPPRSEWTRMTCVEKPRAIALWGGLKVISESEP